MSIDWSYTEEADLAPDVPRKYSRPVCVCVMGCVLCSLLDLLSYSLIFLYACVCNLCMYTCMYVCMYVYALCVRVCACVCVCACMCVCVRVCVRAPVLNRCSGIAQIESDTQKGQANNYRKGMNVCAGVYLCVYIGRW